MFDSIFPNRLKEDDESAIVENDSLEGAAAALEINQVEGRSYPGIICSWVIRRIYPDHHDVITINDGIWISLIDNSKSENLCNERNEVVQSSIYHSNSALDSDPPSFLTNSISAINPNLNVSTESGGIENGETVHIDGTQIAPNIIRGTC